MGDLQGVGLGHRRFRASAIDAEAFWFGDGAQRSYSSADAENRRQRYLPYSQIDGVSAAGAGHGASAAAIGRSRRKAAIRPWHQDCRLHPRSKAACRYRSTVSGELVLRRATGTLILQVPIEESLCRWRGGRVSYAWVLRASLTEGSGHW